MGKKATISLSEPKNSRVEYWWSINLYADSFLKLAGIRIDGKSNFDSAAKAVAEYWRERGADTRGFFIRDGSGLSPAGSLTAANLSDILRQATREKTFPDFYQSIAVLGQTGTVRNMGKGTRAAGNVRAKSGSIDGTRAYAGYVTARSGELLSFAIIAHKYSPSESRLMGQELAKILVLLGEL
jgi:D-alanyl-D-alanine carboxypeptidase/D-alanyl-D-alanine-endopeptidase (penicillin-binding protein 4)